MVFGVGVGFGFFSGTDTVVGAFAAAAAIF
jgi:hypothetical protein